MLDARLRRQVAPALDRAVAPLARAGIDAGALTALALALGIGACVAVATKLWIVGLVLWLANRLLDGLDGPLARRKGSTELGGLLDFVADFVVYSGFVAAVAIAHPSSRLACVVLLATYLVNNVALLGFSSMVERLGLSLGDERSLRFTAGLAEGTETIVVYVLFCLLPDASTTIAWAFAAAVTITALQRITRAVQVLGAAEPGS